MGEEGNVRREKRTRSVTGGDIRVETAEDEQESAVKACQTGCHLSPGEGGRDYASRRGWSQGG